MLINGQVIMTNAIESFRMKYKTAASKLQVLQEALYNYAMFCHN